MEVIFSEGPFTLVKKQGVGMNNTPWEGLEVKSSDAADKHVVEIRLEPNWPKFEGQPVKYSYNPEKTNIAHGMRMSADTLADTQEYIEVLQAALSFVKRVNDYIINNDWT